MKFNLLCFLPFAIQLAQVVAIPQAHNHKEDCKETSEVSLPDVVTVPTNGSTNSTNGLPPGFILEEPLDLLKPAKTPGAKLIKIRYGPYSIAAGKSISTMASNVKKPCTNCYITAAQAGLEYVNGTIANVDTGAWLHHMVLYTRGGVNADLVCPSSLLYRTRRRIFATGNERVVTRINHYGDYGIKVEPTDQYGMIIELMNEGTVEKSVYITMIYEYVELANAEKYVGIDVAWLDATGCGASSVPAKEGVYAISSPGWNSTIAGKMIFAAGHVHDGGVNTTVFLNGEVVCVSEMLYGRTPGFVAPGMQHDGHRAPGFQHISDAGACKNFGEVKVGDNLVAVSYYDTNKYPSMQHDGEAHPVMGIALIAIAPLQFGKTARMY
ncbi:hypothetical protein BZA05DRAFT_433949 [Tricharina praecox]|uniref:uncharacterized protein n=1 Tax=Tricharina praecox TaxID=43433 RepID=UPI0022210DE0|nr:uncharacterized protein BZA05DRAFT_433949 [Tricharina praecox]KAI5856333.1 hypothetical protein BZA05DRAFT_433949 [Tricharina praecox]